MFERRWKTKTSACVRMCVCARVRAWGCSSMSHWSGCYLCALWNSLLICLFHLNLTTPERSNFVTGRQIAASWPLRAALLFHLENKKHWPVHFCRVNSVRLKRHRARVIRPHSLFIRAVDLDYIYNHSRQECESFLWHLYQASAENDKCDLVW